jgi:hypothetical protein
MVTWRIEQLHKTRMGADHWIVLPGIYQTREMALAARWLGDKQRVIKVAEKPDVC